MATEEAPRIGLHLSNHGPARANVELAKAAEDAGLDSVWVSEDLYFRGAMPIAGAIAATTRRIPIGFGVLTPYSRHVSLIAMELASLIDIAGSRIIGGLGAGVAARTRAMAIEYANPVTTVAEVLDALRRLLRGETVTYAGVVHSATDLKLSFSDLPPVPPIYVAAVGPKALAQAGAIADGVVLSLMASRTHVSWARAQVRAGATTAGRDGAIPLLAYVPLALARRSEDAVASMKPYIAYYVQRWARIESLAPLFTRWGPLSNEELLALATKLEDGGDAAKLIPDGLVTDYVVAGDVDSCVEQIDTLREAGVTDVIFDLAGSDGDRIGDVRRVGELRSAVLAASASMT